MQKSVGLLLCGVFAFLFLDLASGTALAATKPAATRQVFPAFVFGDILSKSEQLYLGIPGRKNFSLRNIQARVIVADMFNTYCTTCPRNVPVLNELHSNVENNPRLKGRIKVIAIAVGNTPEEIASYRKANGVRYPILSDPNFTLHRLLGDPRVPYTMIVKNNVIVHAHLGVMDSPSEVLELALKYLRQG